MSDFCDAMTAVAQNQGVDFVLHDEKSDDRFVKTLAQTTKSRRFVVVVDWDETSIRFEIHNENSTSLIPHNDNLISAFKASRMYDFLSVRGRVLHEYVNSEVSKFNQVSSAFSELF